MTHENWTLLKIFYAGTFQGKLIKRQRLPKNDQGDNWHWKDLNLAMNVTFYGKVFRLTNCDQFTAVSRNAQNWIASLILHNSSGSSVCTSAIVLQEFLESEGIILNAPEAVPQDPYTKSRDLPLRSYVTPSDFDKLNKFLKLDRKVRFPPVGGVSGAGCSLKLSCLPNESPRNVLGPEFPPIMVNDLKNRLFINIAAILSLLEPILCLPCNCRPGHLLIPPP